MALAHHQQKQSAQATDALNTAERWMERNPAPSLSQNWAVDEILSTLQERLHHVLSQESVCPSNQHSHSRSSDGMSSITSWLTASI